MRSLKEIQANSPWIAIPVYGDIFLELEQVENILFIFQASFVPEG